MLDARIAPPRALSALLLIEGELVTNGRRFLRLWLSGQVLRHIFTVCVLLASVSVLRPDRAQAQFVYYSPMTVRTLGMGSVASADPSDGTNAWANPAVTSSLTTLNGAVNFRSYAISSAEFRDFSAFLGGSYSNHQCGAAAAGAYHSENIDFSTSSTRDDAYHLIGSAYIVVRQLKFAIGVTRKWYSLPPIASKDKNSLTDVGLLAVWKTHSPARWQFDGSVGYSWLNKGDEAQTGLFGPIQIVSTQRYGAWLVARTPKEHRSVFGEDSVSAVEVSLAFDTERTTSREEYHRYLFGSEIIVWDALFARAGYVHDEILAEGARDGSFGFGIKVSAPISVELGYSRFPVLHNVYSSSVGAELIVKW